MRGLPIDEERDGLRLGDDGLLLSEAMELSCSVETSVTPFSPVTELCDGCCDCDDRSDGGLARFWSRTLIVTLLGVTSIARAAAAGEDGGFDPPLLK